nr:NAD(P)H-binding protein [Saccharothrix sp. NRRL B-16348]
MVGNKVLVTGATGNVGAQVVRQLVAAGVAPRALSRRADAGLPDGVEVVRGHHFDPATLAAALVGVDRVFLVWPAFTADAADAVAEVIGARRVVLLSSGAVVDGVEEQPHPIGRYHAEVERAVARAGAEWTFLRPHGFAANTRAWAPEIRAGDVVRGAYGQAASTLIHEADIAAVAVRALTTTGHAGAAYELTGPEVLTRVEQVGVIGEALGRPLRWEELSREEERERSLSWLPASVVDSVLDGQAELVHRPLPPTTTVEEVTGTPARPFREWVADHVDDFR